MANLKGLEGHIELTRGDFADPVIVQAAVTGCDVVVSFAAERHVDRSLLDCMPRLHSNVVGVQVLLGVCRRHGVRSFLQNSTDVDSRDLCGRVISTPVATTTRRGSGST